MTDCLLIGFNDSSFPGFVEMVRSMGADSGAYRDLNLAFIEHAGRPRTSMEMLNLFRFEGTPGARPLHNCDFLWPTILYLGTFLHRRGFTFDYVNTFQLEKEALREKLQRGDVRTVAITTTLYVSVHPILEIIELVREYDEKVKIVVGGPYISNQAKLLDPAELRKLFDFLGADFYVISQEGEQTLANLLTALKEGGRLSEIANLSYREGQEFVLNPLVDENNSLEANMIDYGLFPRSDIGEFVSVRTAKSCPFSCAFCGFPQRAGDYRYLSVELVEKELNALADLGVTTITFLDDTFNVPKRRFREILELMIRNRYGFRWNSFYRSDHGDEKIIDLMAEAGCEGVFLGIESGSDRMLKTMNKTAHRADYHRAIPLLQSRGISAHANVIVGFPSESLETYEETISLIEETGPDFYRAQLWYADPVTPIWNRREEFGVKGAAFNWSHDTMDFHTACDWVDRMFLSIQNSVWLPQNGFEQWSTFYLQRKGMSKAQIKAFLRSFNALVKQKLVSPAEEEPDPALMEALCRNARPDWTPETPQEPLEVWSGARYLAAETFWLGELEGFEGSPVTEMLHEPAAGPEGWLALPFQLDGVLVDRLQTQLAAGIEPILLAAFTALMSRTSGQEDLMLVVAGGTAERRPPLPLRLRPAWDSGFRALLDGARQSLRQGEEHAHFGLHLLTNPWRLARVGLAEPVFELGFAFRRAGEDTSLAGALAGWPRVAATLMLGLEARLEEDRLAAELVYRGGLLRRATAEQLTHHLLGILQALGDNPDLEVGAIATDARTRPAAPAVAADAADVFEF